MQPEQLLSYGEHWWSRQCGVTCRYQCQRRPARPVTSVVKYLNTQVFKYYLNTMTGIWKRYLNTP